MPNTRSAKRSIARIACAALLWTCSLHAGDPNKAVSGTKEASTSETVAAPQGMTERELYLLNEIELLKKRLSELEARLGGNASPESVTSAPGAKQSLRKS